MKKEEYEEIHEKAKKADALILGIEHEKTYLDAAARVSGTTSVEMVGDLINSNKTVIVVKPFKGDGKKYEIGDKYRPNITARPRAIMLAEQGYLTTPEAWERGVRRKVVKDILDEAQKEYKLMNEARRAFQIAQDEKIAAQAALRGAEAEIERATAAMGRAAQAVFDAKETAEKLSK